MNQTRVSERTFSLEELAPTTKEPLHLSMDDGAHSLCGEVSGVPYSIIHRRGGVCGRCVKLAPEWWVVMYRRLP